MADQYTGWAEQFFDPGRASKEPEPRTGVRVRDPGIVVIGLVLVHAARATYGQFGPKAGRGTRDWTCLIRRSPGSSASPGMGCTSTAQVRVIEALAVATGWLAAAVEARHG
jgi:hypothetical protein